MSISNGEGQTIPGLTDIDKVMEAILDDPLNDNEVEIEVRNKSGGPWWRVNVPCSEYLNCVKTGLLMGKPIVAIKLWVLNSEPKIDLIYDWDKLRAGEKDGWVMETQDE